MGWHSGKREEAKADRMLRRVSTIANGALEFLFLFFFSFFFLFLQEIPLRCAETRRAAASAAAAARLWLTYLGNCALH